MKDYLISMFIDDELNLDEKIEFVETVHQDAGYAEETIEFLEQEKMLRTPLPFSVPEIQLPVESEHSNSSMIPLWLNPVTCLGFAVAITLMVVYWPASEAPVGYGQEYRFVLFQPDTEQAEVVGSFTDWKPLPMERISAEGYWSLTLQLPAGEHRYTFLLDSSESISDPSVPNREKDDFGGENSIIHI